MTYYCQFLLSTLHRGDPTLTRWGEPFIDAAHSRYESCGAELRWDGEHGLSCPAHGPKRIAERLAPIHPGSVILEPTDVCTI